MGNLSLTEKEVSKDNDAIHNGETVTMCVIFRHVPPNNLTLC